METHTSPAPASEPQKRKKLKHLQDNKKDELSTEALLADNSAPKLTLKQRRFVEVTARTLNPTEGAAQAYETRKNRGLAHTIASENMRKPQVKKALERALSTQKQDKDILQEAYAAKRVDKITYGELHRFWRTALELKGKLHHDNQHDVNIGFFIDNS